jgi:hypothetical protein
MAAITKVSLSFKETRQKTLAKLEGIALLSLLGAALKNKFFQFLNVFKRKLLVKFGGCFLNFSVFCVVFVCLRKVFWEKEFIFCLVVGFSFSKSITIKITKLMFFGQTESVVFSRDIFKGAAAPEFLLFFLKDLLCLFKKLVIQSQMRFSVRFRWQQSGAKWWSIPEKHTSSNQNPNF